MDVSRITRGKITLRKQPIELGTALRGAMELSRQAIEAAHHELTLELPSSPLIVEGDAVRLAQVFADLLNNAAKYTADGGRIQVVVGREDDVAVISVRDNGSGISREMLPHVFELFVQDRQPANRAPSGLGIGLTLARRLVEMHAGSVVAHSEGPGCGSEFVVRLPLAAALTAGKENERVARGTRLADRRILVVDDNRDAASSLGTLLEALGADVRVVCDGQEALAALDTFRPSVIVLDIGMPGMDGHEVARRVRQRPGGGNTTLIALTGWGQEEDRRRSQAAGFDHHLVKPADIGALQALLASLDEAQKDRVGS
jgi:CheY-like chemotaxis protein